MGRRQKKGNKSENLSIHPYCENLGMQEDTKGAEAITLPVVNVPIPD